MHLQEHSHIESFFVSISVISAYELGRERHLRLYQDKKQPTPNVPLQDKLKKLHQ